MRGTWPWPGNGATLLVYTDGLIERRGEDIDVGLDRMRACAGALHGPTLKAALRQLVEALHDPGRDDDVTAVALRREHRGP